MLRDLRLAVRAVVRDPGFAAATIGTLALGIGASTAIFTLAYGIWLKPLPYADASRLVTLKAINRSAGTRPTGISAIEFEAYRQVPEVFQGIAGYMYTPTIAKVGDEPRRIVAYAASSNFLDVLGRRPALGRPFEPQDERRDAPPVILLSDAFWRRVSGGDPSIVGKTLDVVGAPATVIGVMPSDFAFPYGRTDVWQPLTPNVLEFTGGMRAIEAIGRLAEADPLERAQAGLDTTAANLAASRPDTNRGWGALARPLHDEIFEGYDSAFGTLVGAVSFLLLVACANAGGLLLSRQISRQPAVAVCIALGATRWRVIRQILSESLLLAALGGAVGIVIAWTATPALANLLPRSTPRVGEVQVNAAVLMTAVGISLVAGLLAALAPALRPLPVRANLQFGTRSIAGTVRLGVQSGLVVAQFTVCLVLVLAGALMLKSFIGLTNRPLGFTPEGVLTAHLSVPVLNPEQGMRYANPTARVGLYLDVIRKIAALPGVTSAAAVTGYPGSSLGYLGSVRLPAPGRAVPINAALRACTSGYFQTMDVRVTAGRMFADAGAPEAVINEALARDLWNSDSAIGKQISLPPGMSGLVATETPYSVVGIVANMRSGSADEPAVFIPKAKSRAFWTDLVVRTNGSPAALGADVRTILRREEKDLLIEDVLPMTEVIGQRLYLPRAQTYIVALFASVSLLLAAVGLYSLMVHFAALRTSEFGVRLALGATASDVRNMVMRRGLLLSVLGTGIGAAAAALLGEVLRNRLFGLQQLDPGALAVAPAMLLACALGATFLAARRAGNINVIDALRSER